MNPPWRTLAAWHFTGICCPLPVCRLISEEQAAVVHAECGIALGGGARSSLQPWLTLPREKQTKSRRNPTLPPHSHLPGPSGHSPGLPSLHPCILLFLARVAQGTRRSFHRTSHGTAAWPLGPCSALSVLSFFHGCAQAHALAARRPARPRHQAHAHAHARQPPRHPPL